MDQSQPCIGGWSDSLTGQGDFRTKYHLIVQNPWENCRTENSNIVEVAQQIQHLDENIR